ncbi:MAG: NUDIX domain-containing protein [Chloroflexota bacterium]
MNDDQPRPWQKLRRRTVYESPWIHLHQDDVRLPDGSIIDGHHVVDFLRPSVGILPIGTDGRILMIEQYRFISDSTGWAIPTGRVDEGEELVDAAQRELHEEAGYRAVTLEQVGYYYPIIGSGDLAFHIFIGYNLEHVGEPTTPNEILQIAWFHPDEVWSMIEANTIVDGMSVTALLWYFAR